MLIDCITNYGILDWNMAEKYTEDLNINYDEFEEYIKELSNSCAINTADIDPVAAVIQIAFNRFDNALYELSNQLASDNGAYVYSNALDSQVDNIQAIEDILDDIALNIEEYDYQEIINFENDYKYFLDFIDVDNITSREKVA